MAPSSSHMQGSNGASALAEIELPSFVESNYLKPMFTSKHQLHFILSRTTDYGNHGMYSLRHGMT